MASSYRTSRTVEARHREQARREQDRFEDALHSLGKQLSRALRGAMRRAGMKAADLARETGCTRRLIGVAMGVPGDIKDPADLYLADWVALFQACGVGLGFKIKPRTRAGKARAALKALAEEST